MDAENYANLTRPWFTSHSPFPLNFFVPGRQASLALSRILLTKAESPLLNITEVEGKVWENRSIIMYDHNSHLSYWVSWIALDSSIPFQCHGEMEMSVVALWDGKQFLSQPSWVNLWIVETRGSWNMSHNECAIVVIPSLIIMNIKIVWLVIDFLLDLQWSQRVPEFALPQTWELPLLLWRHVSFSISFIL